jgi:hypothetical protein
MQNGYTLFVIIRCKLVFKTQLNVINNFSVHCPINNFSVHCPSWHIFNICVYIYIKPSDSQQYMFIIIYRLKAEQLVSAAFGHHQAQIQKQVLSCRIFANTGFLIWAWLWLNVAETSCSAFKWYVIINMYCWVFDGFIYIYIFNVINFDFLESRGKILQVLRCKLYLNLSEYTNSKHKLNKNKLIG